MLHLGGFPVLLMLYRTLDLDTLPSCVNNFLFFLKAPKILGFDLDSFLCV